MSVENANNPTEVVPQAAVGRRLDYTVKMTPEDRKDLGFQIKDEIRRFIEATETRRGNLFAWRRDYE